jgi:sugar fermentation stimulation protein A
MAERLAAVKEIPSGGSVLDYLLDCQGTLLYVETKSAVLREGQYAMYPDCPTARGRRHVGELAAHSRAGGAVALVFIAALPKVQAFKPYRAGDPELCRLLTEARRKGVNIRALALLYDPKDADICLYNADLPVDL